MVDSSPERGTSAYMSADSPISAADMLARARRRKSAAAAAADASRAGPSTSRIGETTMRREMASTPFRRQRRPSVASLLSSPQREAAVRASLFAAGQGHDGLELSRALDFSPPPEAMGPPGSRGLGSPAAISSSRLDASVTARGTVQRRNDDILRTPIANRSNMSLLGQRRRRRSVSSESSISGASSASSTAIAMAKQKKRMMANWSGAREESPMDLLRRLANAPGLLPTPQATIREMARLRTSLTPTARRNESRSSRGLLAGSQSGSLAQSIAAVSSQARQSVGGSTSLAASELGQGRRQARSSLPENPFAGISPAMDGDETFKRDSFAFARPSLTRLPESRAEDVITSSPANDLAAFARPMIRMRGDRDIGEREREMELLLARVVMEDPTLSIASPSALAEDTTLRQDSTMYTRSSLVSTSRSRLGEETINLPVEDEAAAPFSRPMVRARDERDIRDREREMEELLGRAMPNEETLDEVTTSLIGLSTTQAADESSIARYQSLSLRSSRRSDAQSISAENSQRLSASQAGGDTLTLEQSRDDSQLTAPVQASTAGAATLPLQEQSDASRVFEYDNIVDDYPVELGQSGVGAGSMSADVREGDRTQTTADASVQYADVVSGSTRHIGRLSEQTAPLKRKALATIEEEEMSGEEDGLDAASRKDLQAARMVLLKKRRVRKRQQRIAPLTGQSVPPLPSSLVRELFCTLATPSVGMGLAGATTGSGAKTGTSKAKVERSALDAVEDLSHHFFAQFAHDLVLQAEHKPVPSTRITEADIVSLLTAQGHVSQRQPITSLARKYLPRELSDLLVAAEADVVQGKSNKGKKRLAVKSRRGKVASPASSNASGRRPALQQRVNRQSSEGNSYQDDDDDEDSDE